MTPLLKQNTAPGNFPAQTRLIDLVFPGDTNHHGTLFGGAGFALMDRIAFISATRHGRVPFVTASCDRIDFRAPARIGQLVELVARPVRAGRRSLTIDVEMIAEDLIGGDALAAMTKAAFVAASRRSRMVTVLASSRRIDFKRPVPVGSIIDVVAEIVQTGRSSMIVAVELWSETLLDGGRQLTACGEFVMVSVGPDGRPIAYPVS